MTGKILKGPSPFIRREVHPASSGDPDKVDVTIYIPLGPADKRAKCRICKAPALRGDLCLRCHIAEQELQP